MSKNQTKPALSRPLLPDLVGLVGSTLIRFIFSFCRVEFLFKTDEDRKFFFKHHNSNSPHPQAPLIAFFHQQEMLLMCIFADRNYTVLTSLSKDGELLNQAIQNLGYRTVRGSPRKRAVAGLIECIREAKKGHKVTMAVDGPKGPIYQVKEGIIAVSQKADKPIVPVCGKANWKICFHKSWNKAYFPIPGAKIQVKIGPIKKYSKDELEVCLKSLEDDKNFPIRVPFIH